MTGPSTTLYCVDDLEGVYDRPTQVGRLAGLLRQTPEDAVVVGAGDDTALGTLAVLVESGLDPTTYVDDVADGIDDATADSDDAVDSTDDATVESREPAADVNFPERGRGVAEPFFEVVAHDAETLGNHDLDLGASWARDWADRVPPTYCCGNLHVDGERPFRAHTTVTAGDALVGITGVTHPDTTEIAVGIEATVSDPVETARTELDRLRSQGVDYTVVLSHCGEDDWRLARETTADAVVGGHVHEQVTTVVDDTALVRAGGPERVPSVELSPGQSPEVAVHRVDDAPLHEPTRETYRAYRDALAVDTPIASVSEPMRRTQTERVGGESRAGNFLADAITVAADADCGVFPAGSLRTGPTLSGDITVGDVVSLCPFDDTVRRLQLTGDQLREVLAACTGEYPSYEGWVHAHVSGLRVRWNDEGDLLSARLDGDPLDSDATYTVASTGWFVVTDAYHPADEEHATVTDTSLLDAFLAHARDGGLSVQCEGRIDRTTVE
ncbi:MAG: bifunctional UDP-sugar hydrolase/5'-nucleotidase [Halobaculum sp.]